MTERIPVAG